MGGRGGGGEGAVVTNDWCIINYSDSDCDNTGPKIPQAVNLGNKPNFKAFCD